VVTAGSIAEGTASAADTVLAQALWQTFVAEGSATALDTQDASTGPATYAVSVVEGGATAIDTVDASVVGLPVVGYGGVWMYGLKYYKALRGELDREPEPEPEVVETVAAVVKRTPQPDQDVASRILLRLELEARGRAWQQFYLDVLEAYRAGLADYLNALRVQEQERARQQQERVRQQQELLRVELALAAEAAQRALLRRRRLAAFLLLDP
jgi:hypothetical protein